MELKPLERAALLIYLNKSGFNGLYHVNRKGHSNVPVGRQANGPILPTAAQLMACSKALTGVDLLHSPFAAVLDRRLTHAAPSPKWSSATSRSAAVRQRVAVPATVPATV